MDPVIIIGTGQAGYTTAREFRKLDSETPLTLISADDAASYYKPNLSKALAMGKEPAGLAMRSAEKMAETLDARILSHSRAEAIDPRAHTVTAGSETLSYQKLVLAMGAHQTPVPLDPEAAAHVLTVNSLTDYAAFRRQLVDADHVAILGAGLIGCEFANDLAAAGYRVSVIDPAPQALGRFLPETPARALESALAELGVTWHLGELAQSAQRENAGLRLNLSGGGQVDADLVLSAIGLRPNVALAHDAGLNTNKGIVTDLRLETSAPDIYALGDCAEVCGQILPFVMPITHAAKALGRTLAGQPTPVRYPAMPVIVKTPACPVVVASPGGGGEGSGDGVWEISGSGGDWSARYVDSDARLLGFALTGAAVASKNAFAKELPAWLDN
jgi:rubredoxin-NAD+ reductase